MTFPTRMALAIMIVTPAVGAQTAPDHPDAPTAPPSYQSAFAGYHPYRESETPPQQSWRALNEQAAHIGGHAGQIKDDDTEPTNARDEQQHRQHHQ